VSNADLIAEAENWQKRYSTRDKGDVLIGALVDALRAAEAREKALREVLEPFAKAGELFDFDACPGATENPDANIYSPAKGREWSLSSAHLLAARRALGGE
jgi:hypothetical protein